MGTVFRVHAAYFLPLQTFLIFCGCPRTSGQPALFKVTLQTDWYTQLSQGRIHLVEICQQLPDWKVVSETLDSEAFTAQFLNSNGKG
jgi:hypothetical protein